MKKLIGILSIFVPFLCAFLIQIAVVFVYAIKVAVDLITLGDTDADNLADNMVNSLTSDSLVMSCFIASICLIVFGLWFKNLRKREQKISITQALTLKRVMILFLLGISLQISISAILTVITILKPEWFENYNEIIETLGMGNTAISFLYVGFIGPISEELIFRGVILEKGKKVLPFLAANIIQALLFGIYHGNLVQGLYAFAIGLFLGLVRVKYNTIFASILLHMVINLCGMFMDQILAGQILGTTAAMAVLTLLSVAAIVYCTKNIMAKEEKEDMLEL